MKKALSVLIVILTIFALCSCGGNKLGTITAYNKNTKMADVKKEFKKYEFIQYEREYGYSLVFSNNKQHPRFCDLYCESLDFRFDKSKKLEKIDFLVDTDNTPSDRIDSMIKQMTTKYGEPSVETREESLGYTALGYTATYYIWFGDTDNEKEVRITDYGSCTVTLCYN